MKFFKLSGTEYSRAERFKGRHSGHAAAFTYHFTVQKERPGMTVRIKCNGCGKYESITES